MDLHYGWRFHAQAPAWWGAAAVCAFSPQLLALTGREFVLGDWVGYAMAVIFLLAGIVQVVESLRPLRVTVDAEGISWRKGGHEARARWQDLTRVAIEKAPNSGPKNRPTLLMVWTATPVGEGVAPDVPLPGLAGYRVVDVKDIRETTAQLEDALRHFGAGRFQETAR